MINHSKRPSLGTVINSAAGALQQHALMQQMKAARLDTNASPSKADAGAISADDHYAGIVFSGNPHETVPRRLLLDDRLSPTERNAWQVFRLLINTDGVTAFPTYEQLRPYLGSTPGKSASRETIAKTLTLLRLTRWLSLGRRVRDAVNGRVQGNVYILHDEPIGCAEAMEIDHDYMLLIGQSLSHSNKSIRFLAERALHEVAEDPHLPGSEMPTRLDVMADRLQAHNLKAVVPYAAASVTEFGIRTQEIPSLTTQSSESELCKKLTESALSNLSSESELSRELAELARVRNPNSYSTYTNTNTFVSKSSVQYPEALPGLRLPASLARLSDDQRQQAMLALSKIQADIRQSVLDQWHHRVNSGGVSNPLGYFMGCIQRAMKGEFNARWNAPSTQNQAATAASSPTNTSQLSSKREPAPPPTLDHTLVPESAKRDETTVARGRDQMRDIRQSLGMSRRTGGDTQ